MGAYSNSMKRQHRDKPVFVKTTAVEHKLFTDLAAKRHTTLSELIRQLLHRELNQSKEQAA
jgi:hypothetical protein